MEYDLGMVQLSTVQEVIEHLGGLTAVGALTGCKSGVVWNWKDRNAFPPNTYFVMHAALQYKGFDAPISLWGMREPEKAHQ